MKKLYLALVLVVVSLCMVAPVFAQDVPVEPLPVVSIEEAGALLAAFLTTVIGSAVLNAPITMFLVSIVKRLDKEQRVSSEGWALITGGTLTVLVWLARYFGFEIALNNAFQLVVVAGPLIISLMTTLFGAGILYQGAKVVHAPIIGYERPAKKAA